MIVAVNAYRWSQFYEQAGTSLNEHLDEAMAEGAEAGADAWEPFWDDEHAVDRYAVALNKHGLVMRSHYTPANFLGSDIDGEIATIVRRCLAAKELGASLAVTNPDPVDWNHTPKPEAAIRIQAKALSDLGHELGKHGITLAYHFHSSELLCGARELNHTLLHVGADAMKICLDAHWAWRGCGDSQMALEDLILQHGKRIETVHLRQSQGGIWAETLGNGDIDYRPLFKALRDNQWDGVACIELAYEPGTPVTMGLAKAHAESVAWLRQAWDHSLSS